MTPPAEPSTYFRKGFGLQSEVRDDLAADYDGRVVDLLRSQDYRLTVGDVTIRLAREFGIATLVHSLGAQEEVVPLLSIADLFLLPSAQESFGLAALEAMACEVPVVASRVGGLPEVIEHGVSGFLHAPDALDEMAASGVMVLRDCDKKSVQELAAELEPTQLALHDLRHQRAARSDRRRHRPAGSQRCATHLDGLLRP